MSNQSIVGACALIVCCFALLGSATADCERGTIQTADAAPPGAYRSLYGARDLATGRDEAETVEAFQQRANQGDLDAMNRLGIMYVRGRGVAKNYGVALRLFRQSALQGYAPAMVNLGTMYQLGAGGHRSYRRAYAWLRVALSFGVPEGDRDATVFRLGMVASKIGPTNATRAERLAGDIAEQITKKCNYPQDRYADWVYEGDAR